MEIGRKIKEYLLANGIKSLYVSEKTGITQNALTLILNGKRKLLADEYVLICGVLGVSLSYFVSNETKSA